MKTNYEKLKDKIQDKMDNEGLRSIHVDWGPKAKNLTDEEICVAMLEFWEEADAQEKNVVTIPVYDLTSIARALSSLSKLGTASVESWLSMSKEERELRFKVRELVGMNHALAEQRLPRNVQKELRDAKYSD